MGMRTRVGCWLLVVGRAGTTHPAPTVPFERCAIGDRLLRRPALGSLSTVVALGSAEAPRELRIVSKSPTTWN